MSTENKAGLDALLTPEESVLVLIDHQPFQFADLNNHETFPTVMGDVRFGNGSRQIVVSPPESSSGELIFPYAEAFATGQPKPLEYGPPTGTLPRFSEAPWCAGSL
ncbi:hypothetical protein ABZ897_38925 [Nonomuraea sp. NPDC046802]|uniref:hypothetical protein n=1 Tax=Nonomuraea sp. NPDC046802 TaxID=3154919 RepID=UPI0033E02FA7